MKIKDIKKISAEAALVENSTNDTWPWGVLVTEDFRDYSATSHVKKENRRADYFRFAEKSPAVALCFKDKASAIRAAKGLKRVLVLESTDDKNYKIIESNVKTEYLNGLATGAKIISYILGPEYPPHHSEKSLLMVQEDLEEYMARVLSFSPYAPAPRSDNVPMSSLLKHLSEYSKEYQVTDSEEYSLKELQKISGRFGLISKPAGSEDYNLNAWCTKQNRKVRNFEAGLGSLVEHFNCDLIAERLPNDKYKIIYCETGKNYLRGLTAAALVLDETIKQPGIPISQKYKQLQQKLIEYANLARGELGYKKLSSKYDIFNLNLPETKERAAR